jgi:hypothetical protein
MRQALLSLIAVPFFINTLLGQFNPSVELSSAFPLSLYQHGPREYFMTTKYDASIAFRSGTNSEFITSFTFTQQQPIFTQYVTPFDGIRAASQTYYVPFTTDPYYTEYGLYSGVRLKTNENTIQAFITGQLGVTGTRYGTITRIPYTSPEPFPGGPSYRSTEGTVIRMQMAAMYGVGLLWHPVNSISIMTGLQAVDRLTKQSLDVYRSIGIQFAL